MNEIDRLKVHVSKLSRIWTNDKRELNEMLEQLRPLLKTELSIYKEELGSMVVDFYDMEWKDPVMNELINKIKELES